MRRPGRSRSRACFLSLAAPERLLSLAQGVFAAEADIGKLPDAHGGEGLAVAQALLPQDQPARQPLPDPPAEAEQVPAAAGDGPAAARQRGREIGRAQV